METAKKSRGAGDVTELLSKALGSNPIIAGQGISPMSLITSLPLGVPGELRREINMLRGLRLPIIIEGEFLTALLAKGVDGEVPGILHRFWGSDLRSHFPRGVRMRGGGQDITASRERFLREVSPGLEKLLYADLDGVIYIEPLYSYEPADICGELYPTKDTEDIDPKVQLAFVERKLGELLPWGNLPLHSRAVAESLDASLREYTQGHSPEEVERVEEAVLATKLRYMNSYTQGRENAQRFIRSMAFTMEEFSLDTLVEFHTLAEEYNWEWAMAACQGFSLDTSSLMGELREMISSVPGYGE